MDPLLNKTLPKISSGNGMRPHGGGLRSSATCSQLVMDKSSQLIRSTSTSTFTYPSCCHSAIPFNEGSSTLSTLSPITLCRSSANSSFSTNVPAFNSPSLLDQPMTARGKSSIELPEGSSLSDRKETGYFLDPV